MFIGHFAVAFAAKKAVPKVSLATLVVSAEFLDVLWPVFLMFGLEHVHIDPGNTAFSNLDFYDYPLSHSLMGALVWSVVVGGGYYAWRRPKGTALVLGALVFSHWVLDLVVHRADLPLAPGVDSYFGLGVWNSVAGTYFLEGTLYLCGIALYLRSTEAWDKIGRFGLWSLALALPVLWVGSALSPPPPDATSIAVVALLGVCGIMLWAWWADRHRRMAA